MIEVMICSMEILKVATSQRSEMVELTRQVQRVAGAMQVVDGLIMVYVPHTTAGITINENADPNVVYDVLAQLEAMVPWDQPFYRHGEGNSAAHVKASMMGSSVMVMVNAGRLVLGRWQGIYLCEFDGPRTRQIHVQTDQ